MNHDNDLEDHPTQVYYHFIENNKKCYQICYN